MAPFGDAVCFVDGNAGQLALMVDGSKQFAKVWCCTELWCNIDEACVWMTTLQVGLDAFALGIGGA